MNKSIYVDGTTHEVLNNAIRKYIADRLGIDYYPYGYCATRYILVMDRSGKFSDYKLGGGGILHKETTLISLTEVVDLLDQWDKEREETILIDGKEFSLETVKVALKKHATWDD